MSSASNRVIKYRNHASSVNIPFNSSLFSDYKSLPSNKTIDSVESIASPFLGNSAVSKTFFILKPLSVEIIKYNKPILLHTSLNINLMFSAEYRVEVLW